MQSKFNISFIIHQIKRSLNKTREKAKLVVDLQSVWSIDIASTPFVQLAVLFASNSHQSL